MMLCMSMKDRKGTTIEVFQIINKNQGTFTKEDSLFLKVFFHHAALSNENAWLMQARLEHERVNKDLHIAANIQHMIIPKVFPGIPGYQIVAEEFPSKEIGRDFYNIIPLHGNLLPWLF
jgi:phosphoserine phosphatase RsbU/P